MILPTSKTILHLCADTGSDSIYYKFNGYNVIRVGSDVGVENFTPPKDVYGVFANPPCTEFSSAKGPEGDHEKGMFLVNHCMRVIHECNPKFWVLENPARGRLRRFIGKPKYSYHPWQYGDPWTKHTALWGNFNIPEKLYTKWEDVTQNPKLYIRPGYTKPSLVLLGKNAKKLIPAFDIFDDVGSDMELRSLCSPGFAKQFYEVNK